MNREATLEAVLAIAREAEAIIARIYEGEPEVEYKGPGDPVTNADKQANALICKRLASLFPNVPIVAEESDESSFSGWRGAPRSFFVDPLDGTIEFVARSGDFAIMIGMAEEGRATLGVILAPTTGRAWMGALGVGAWEVSRDGKRTQLRVSETPTLDRARVVVTRSHKSPQLESVLDAIAPAVVTPLGSAGLKAVRVAKGEADLYLQPGRSGKRWDSCAPEAIVLAAGGRFTDASGKLIDYAGGPLENSTGVLVSNGILHEAALAKIRQASQR